MTTTVLDDVTKTWLHYLHRGGQYGYWWTAQSKSSTWWKIDAPAPVPNGAADHYVGVHPTGDLPDNPALSRAKIATVAAVNCFFSEYDGKDFADGKTGALAHVKALALAPTVVIDSGGGYHCYWFLAEPFLLATDEDRERARKAQAAWVGFTKGDDGAKDLARVLRIPGTRNYKYNPPRPVVIIDADFQRLYTFDELEAITAAGAKTTQAAQPSVTPRSDGSPLDNGATPARLLDMALGRVGAHGRNDTGLWLANQLRDNDYSIDEAGPIMLDFQRAVVRQGDHEYDEGEALKTLRSAYAGNKREPWQSDRLRFGGHRQDAVVFRRGKLAYAVTPQDDGYSIKANVGKHAENVHLAGDLGLLDEASGGRAYFGIARGAWLDALGLHPTRPIQAVREAIEMVQLLLAGDTSGYTGQVFQLIPGERLRWTIHRPRVPVLLGAWGSQLIKATGDLIDEVKVGGTANPALMPVMRERIGRPEVGLAVGAVSVVDEDRGRAQALARREVALYLPVVAALDPTYTPDADEMARVQDAVSQGDREAAARAISDATLRRFAFAGTPDDLVRHIADLADAGATRVELGTPHGLDEAEAIRLLGRRVVPALK